MFSGSYGALSIFTSPLGFSIFTSPLGFSIFTSPLGFSIFTSPLGVFHLSAFGRFLTVWFYPFFGPFSPGPPVLADEWLSHSSVLLARVRNASNAMRVRGLYRISVLQPCSPRFRTGPRRWLPRTGLSVARGGSPGERAPSGVSGFSLVWLWSLVMTFFPPSPGKGSCGDGGAPVGLYRPLRPFPWSGYGFAASVA